MRATGNSSRDAVRALALTQGLYFAATGIWPLVHMPSFEAVTGRKIDKWLVKTVGVLIAVVGGVLVSAAARRNVNAEVESGTRGLKSPRYTRGSVSVVARRLQSPRKPRHRSAGTSVAAKAAPP